MQTRPDSAQRQALILAHLGDVRIVAAVVKAGAPHESGRWR
jgi:hypothetical protein